MTKKTKQHTNTPDTQEQPSQPIDTGVYAEQVTRDNPLKTNGTLVLSDDERFNTGKSKGNKLPKDIKCDFTLLSHAKKDGTTDSVIWIERRTMANKFETPYIRIPSFIPMEQLEQLTYNNGKKDVRLVTMYHGSKKCVGKSQIEAFIKSASVNNEIKEYKA